MPYVVPYIRREVLAMDMKKTSVYLSEEDRERLARLAERKGQSQAWVMREALLAYDVSGPDKNFAIFDSWKHRDPNIPESPHFDDPQEYHDWLEKTIGEAMLADYEEQMREARAALQ